MIISTIATIPGMLLHFYLFGFLRESRPFQIDDLHLLIFFFGIAVIDFNVLAYMFREEKRQQLFPEKTVSQSLFEMIFRGKTVGYVSFFLVIPLTVLTGLSLYQISRPGPVIVGNSSLKLLDYIVIDADYSDELNSIVMISDEPSQLHVFDPVLDHQTSIDILNTPTMVSVNPAGTHAAIGHYQSDNISYVDLRSGQVQVFNIGENCQDVALIEEQILCSYKSAYGTQLKSVEVSTGNMVISSLRRRGRWSFRGIKLFPGSQRLFVIDHSGDIYDQEEPIYGFKAENLWFSSDRKQIVTNNAQVFDVGEGEHTTKYVADIQGVSSIVGVSHSQSIGNYLVITGTDPGVVFIDDETLERKDMIPYPEVQVDKWTEGNLPRLESLFYTPVGQFIFANNKIPEYYVIGYVRYIKSIVIINDF